MREKISAQMPHDRTSDDPTGGDPAGGAVVGVDVGGTFTDLLLVEGGEGGRVRIAKTPTTPGNQAFGVISALEATGFPVEDVGLVVHGTTTTTNAVISAACTIPQMRSTIPSPRCERGRRRPLLSDSSIRAAAVHNDGRGAGQTAPRREIVLDRLGSR